MPASIETLWRARLKGSFGFFPRRLVIDTTVGVLSDREFAIRRKPGGDMDAWAPKAAFHVCMNTPQMASYSPMFAIDRLHGDDVLELKERLGIQGEPLVQSINDEYSLHDTKGAFVSFLNLASVQALSEHIGAYVDPQRFRMNVWMTGLEPFEELTWVDTYPGTKTIDVGGGCRFRVHDACERCKAIEASPTTGMYDLDLQAALDEMMSKRGYKSPHRGVPRVMGILAQPLNDGQVHEGESIRLVT